MLVISIWSSFGELLVRLKKMVYTSRNLHSNDLRLDVEQQLCMVSRARRGAPDLSFEAVLLQWHRAWEVRSRLATGPWQISAGFPHWVAGARKLASAQASSNHGEFAPASQWSGFENPGSVWQSFVAAVTIFHIILGQAFYGIPYLVSDFYCLKGNPILKLTKCFQQKQGGSFGSQV